MGERVSVSGFKARLSEHLRRVQRGARLVITDHGVPIAEVAAYGSVSMGEDNEDRLVRDLAERGALRLPSRSGKLVPAKRRPRLEARLMSEAVVEDRGDDAVR